MSISTIQNFYKETITRAVTLTGATNIYVSTLPTPDEGYVVISPSSSSLREIVYYTAKGTDGNGSYITVTLANRGLGGTTAQTHVIGEPVRMNVTAEHIKEISDALDQIVAGGAQDASTVTKGITKLSVAPASATEPIAVGDNDPRLIFVSKNFGDGSDGDVTIGAGTTTLTRDMYYDNLVITGTLATDGYKVYVKGTVSGAGILQGVLGANGSDGTSNEAGGAGGAGGAAAGGGMFKSIAGGAGGAAGTEAAGAAGAAGANGNLSIVGKAGGAGGRGYDAPGGAAGAGGTLSGAGKFASSLWASGILITPAGAIEILKAPGSGGGGGGGDSQSGLAGAGGGGGATGGLVFLCAKNWDGTFTIKSTGGNGGNGGNANSLNDGSGGGGGGGNGGPSVVIYGSKTWTGSYLLTGGTGGAKGSASWGGAYEGKAGVDGAAGTSYEINVKTLI